MANKASSRALRIEPSFILCAQSSMCVNGAPMLILNLHKVIMRLSMIQQALKEKKYQNTGR